MLVFQLGNLVCALARSSNQIIAGRAVAGIGGAGIVNGALVIITASSPKALRPMLGACCITMIAVGGILGPLIGGALTQNIGWRWCKLAAFVGAPRIRPMD